MCLPARRHVPQSGWLSRWFVNPPPLGGGAFRVKENTAMACVFYSASVFILNGRSETVCYWLGENVWWDSEGTWVKRAVWQEDWPFPVGGISVIVTHFFHFQFGARLGPPCLEEIACFVCEMLHTKSDRNLTFLRFTYFQSLVMWKYPRNEQVRIISKCV